jgi:ferritin-like metal-binding protein YciE
VSGLFRRELQELLDLERLLLDEVLPDLRERARAAELQAALDRHLVETKSHVNNLERVILLAEIEERELDGDLDVLVSLLRTEAREAASYAFLVHTAAALGAGEECIRLLRMNMEQDEHAGELAERTLVQLLAETVENA